MSARISWVALLVAGVGCTGGDKGEPADTGSGGADATDGGDSVDPLQWSVTEAGPYRLGYQLTETTYTTALGETRTIPVHMWYPTEDTTGASVSYASLFPDPVALGGATPAPPLQVDGYPVVVHSHGHWGVAGAVAFWAERLVSQGWVIIAPDHVGNTFTDGFPSFSEPSPTVHFIERPEDVSAALDHVAGAGLLAGPLQTDAVALSGHSRGSYTAWAGAGATFDPEAVAAACAGESGEFPTGSCTPDEQAVFLSGDLSDARFQSTLTLDGGFRSIFGDTGQRSVHSPVMALRHADSDGTAQGEFDRMDGVDYTWVAVEGACHETFNLGIEASTFAPCATFDRDEGWSLTATYALAFFRHSLQGDDSAETAGILDGSVQVNAAATVAHRAD